MVIDQLYCILQTSKQINTNDILEMGYMTP